MKILFFAISKSSFIEKDYEILRSAHDVTKVEITLLNLSNIVKLIKLIKNYDSVFFWFASLKFFVPCIVSSILSKKIYLVAGGYDVASVNEISYGSCNNFYKKILIRIMLNLATKIFSVSLSNRNEIILNCKIDSSKIVMIYHGFNNFPNLNFQKKENNILTIALLNKISFRRKGIDKFLLLADRMPEVNFYLIGNHDDFIKEVLIPKNVQLLGFVELQKLEEILSISKVYIQLSIHEGFGCSVAEAMQYGCIPVVSNNYALPEVVGECGLILDANYNIDITASKVRSILVNYNSEMGTKCVDRVRDKFNLKNRQELLLQNINK
ncbi:MAG: glycosyltransferase family 4 protein [Ignavibacteriota bacterium]